MSLLQDLFITIVNMSITASCVAIGVILVRLLLKKAPKVFSYILWVPVLFRLACPFSFDSAFSFFNLINPNVKQGSGISEFVPQNIGLMQTPVIRSGIGSIDSAVNASLPPAIPVASVNPIEIWMSVLSFIWISGVVALLIYSIVSYVKIKRKLQTATRVEANVFETDAIGTAFVCGFIHPKIYVPANIGDANLSYILEHERTHIRRKDYLIKPLAFLALILHWFNPLMWLCFALMSRDMEMSCDESVLNRLGEGAKGGYSGSLLSLAVKRKGLLAANPLAFGESHVKARIKNVLNFKKPAFWVIMIAVVAVCIAVVAFVADPKHEQIAPDLYLGYPIQTLMDNKTPYVGNNYKVIKLIDAMPLTKGIVRDTVELQTANLPYGIMIYYEMNDASVIKIRDAISGDAFYRNSIVLFSLIDNVDIISCKIIDKTGDYDEVSYIFTLTRAEAEKLIGEDVRHFAYNADTIRRLIDIINNISLGENHNDIARLIEENLAAIMSSPQEASNPYAYINIHKKEYENILKMGKEALPYLIEILEKEDKGLRGNIAMFLCQDIVKGLLKGSKDISPEIEKSIKEAQMSVDKWNALMGNIPKEIMPEFTKEEVAKARAVVEEYYRAVAAKDVEAILATLYPREGLTLERVKSGNVILFGKEKRTLLSIDYDSQDSMRKNYMPGGKYVEQENIIVFKVSFNVDYPENETGPWNEGIYKNWSMILIRDNKNSPWLIYDQGY
ncbi:M56 family metallopeptidase [Petroclostridium xylanilyticum]|uniref:M56 family metallopeptidase n=1 Tax=Petroclostridium xylanilyticum TaxID=1792311 RepID=UPI000B987B98|nr:M56 family metallopeptidase [Petroclostridium xylanilyticum]